MKILIIGGFLGSGKTTVLMQLARYLVDHSESDSPAPVVILENEISVTGVDHQLLAQANLTVENMFSGCVCCTSALQLAESIKEIERKYKSEWLIIEATGVAYPDMIRQIIKEDLGMCSNILAIVDVKRWKRLVRSMENFVSSQLREADCIFMNKTDLISEEELADVLVSVESYNSAAVRYPVCALEPLERQKIESIFSVLS